jgi:hypothetical protein
MAPKVPAFRMVEVRSCSLITLRSAWACSIVTPGLSRPRPKTVLPQLAVSGVSGKGVMISTSLPGVKIESKSKLRGRMPTMVAGVLLSVTARPTTDFG